MKETCMKCGYTHTLISIDPQAECPNCGVIYAKAKDKIGKIEQDGKREAEGPSPESSNFVKFLLLGGFACLILYYYFGSGPGLKHETQTVKLTEERKDRPKPESTVQRGPLSSSTDFTQEEEGLEVGAIQEGGVSHSRKRQPTTTIVKKTVRHYLSEATISQGETVELIEHLSDGRYTVFFFYSDW